MRKAGLALASLFAFLPLAVAQDYSRFEVSAGGAGVFNKTSTSSNGTVTLKPTSSGAIIASFRFRFKQRHGIEGNLGHTRNSQVFFLPPNNFRVQAGVTEYTAAYVFTPLETSRLEAFMFAGAGGLKFNPGNTYIDGFQSAFGAASRTELAVLYGAGADYRFWKVFAFRLQYRGLIYKAPDFGVPTLYTGAKGHMAEPTAGIVVKF